MVLNAPFTPRDARPAEKGVAAETFLRFIQSSKISNLVQLGEGEGFC